MHYRSLLLIAWAGVAAIYVAIALLLPFSRVSITGGAYFIWLGLLIAATYAAVAAIRFRLGVDRTKLGTMIRRSADRLAVVLHTMAFNFALFLGLLTVSYLTTSIPMPLRDDALAAVDRALGLDWVGFLAFLNERPLLSKTLSLAYWSSASQVAIVYTFLAFANRRERLAESFALMSISAISVCVLGFLFPAIGATAYFHPDPGLLTSFAEQSGMWHYSTFMSLRNDAAPVLDFSAFAGVIQFPSFHVVLAIVITYALRDYRYLFWPLLALNSVVIVSTLPEGGHHLADSITGGLIVVAAIMALRRPSATAQSAPLLRQA